MAKLIAFLIIGLLVLSTNGAPQFYKYDYLPISRSNTPSNMPFGILTNPFQSLQEPQPEGRLFPLLFSIGGLFTRLRAAEALVEELKPQITALSMTAAATNIG